MPSPLYRILYESHPLPLEGVVLSRAEIVRAQNNHDLGRIVVIEFVHDEIERYAMSVSGCWTPLPNFVRSGLNRLVRRLERESDEEEGL